MASSPSAAKWNILGTNDASFNDGSGIADGVIEPVHLDATQSSSTWAWQSWTPTWTNLTVGSGTVTAKYIQIGKTVHAFLKFVYGSGSSVSGVIGFSPPVNASSTYSDLNDSIHSSSLVLDSGSALYVCFLRWSSASLFNLYVYNTAGTYMNVTATSATLPMTWTTNDSLSVSFTYEAA